MGSTTREQNKTEEPEPCLVQSLCILKKSVHDWQHLPNIENKTTEAQNGNKTMETKKIRKNIETKEAESCLV